MKKNVRSVPHYLLLLFALIAAGCATVIRTPDGTEKLKDAIKQNDTDATINILSGKSFTGKASTFFDDQNGPSNRYFDQFQAYLLLDLAITGRAGNSSDYAPRGVCRAGIVKAMLDANLPPRSNDLANAALAPCPDVTEIIVNKLSESDIKTGTEIFLNAFKQRVLDRQISDRPEWTPIFKLLIQKNDSAEKQKIAEAAKLFDQYVFAPIQRAREARQQLEAKFKMKFCANPELFNVIYDPSRGSTIESDCIYMLHGPLKILQVIKSGVLVTLTELNQYIPDKVFFIKTSKQYVDQDPVGEVLVKAAGTISYKNTLGVGKTIHAFQYLSDAK